VARTITKISAPNQLYSYDSNNFILREAIELNQRFELFYFLCSYISRKKDLREQVNRLYRQKIRAFKQEKLYIWVASNRKMKNFTRVYKIGPLYYIVYKEGPEKSRVQMS